MWGKGERGEGVGGTYPAPEMNRKKMNSPMLVDPAEKAPDMRVRIVGCGVVRDRGLRTSAEKGCGRSKEDSHR